MDIRKETWEAVDALLLAICDEPDQATATIVCICGLLAEQPPDAAAMALDAAGKLHSGFDRFIKSGSKAKS